MAVVVVVVVVHLVLEEAIRAHTLRSAPLNSRVGNRNRLFLIVKIMHEPVCCGPAVRHSAKNVCTLMENKIAMIRPGSDSRFPILLHMLGQSWRSNHPAIIGQHDARNGSILFDGEIIDVRRDSLRICHGPSICRIKNP